MSHLQIIGKPKNNKASEKKEKLNKAKKTANMEIGNFNRLVNHMRDHAEKSPIFQSILEDAADLLENYKNEVVIPLVDGNKPLFVDEKDFLLMRAEMFKKIMGDTNEN